MKAGSPSMKSDAIVVCHSRSYLKCHLPSAQTGQVNKKIKYIGNKL